jgi:hypothetical protein
MHSSTPQIWLKFASMMPAFRLDSVAPVLAESFRKASPAKCRQAALVACELAVSSVSLADQEVISALEALRRGTPVKATVRKQIKSLATRFDDEYLRLWEGGDESKKLEALQLFSKACAALALVFALSDDPEQMHEAIYEAIMAMDDPAEVMRSAGRALQ